IQLSHSITTPSLLAHGNCQDYLKSHNQRNRCAARARHRALIGARLARAAGAVNAVVSDSERLANCNLSLPLVPRVGPEWLPERDSTESRARLGSRPGS